MTEIKELNKYILRFLNRKADKVPAMRLGSSRGKEVGRSMRLFRLGIVGTLMLLTPQIFAQAESEDKKAEEKKSDESDFVWRPQAIKAFTKAERDAECRKYEGKLIGYYSQVFMVENCKRREMDDSDQIRVSMRDKVVTVDGDTIIKIPEGKPIGENFMFPKHKRGCKELEGRFVLNGASDIYVVEKCKKMPFPDFETYMSYWEKKGMNREVIELSEQEFSGIKTGKELASVLDPAFKQLMDNKVDPPDVVPIDEACKGIEGRVVAFYTRLYRIEKCRKRELNATRFFEKRENQQTKIIELSASQWISLPDGKPIDNLEDVD